MAAKIICESCNWTGTTRHDQIQPRHRCPKCGSEKLKTVK